MVNTRQKTYDDNNHSVHNEPHTADPRASHPPRPVARRKSVLVEDVPEQQEIQPVLQPTLEPDEIRRMAHLIEEQGRLIEELCAERRRAEAERVNQPPPVNGHPPPLRNLARQAPDILERRTRPAPEAP
jgi:hypothetical protein